MKEQVSTFDFNAAFRALDEIECPKCRGLKSSRTDLEETFTRKNKTDILVEDYYDISRQEDLQDAKAERDGELAKAKLARIERIVDLDADSEEDLQAAYVGKYVIQCPQCMTLFYKKPEDVITAEDNDNLANVGEKCPNCSNDTGYTIIGKIGEVPQEELTDYGVEEAPAEESTEDVAIEEEPAEEPAEEADTEEVPELELEELPKEELEEVPAEEEEEEKKEESFKQPTGQPLHEDAENCQVAFIDETGSLAGEKADKAEQAAKANGAEDCIRYNREDDVINYAKANNNCKVSVYTYNDDLMTNNKNLPSNINIVKVEDLNEDIDKELNKKLEEHNDYIAYLQAEIENQEKALDEAKNEFVRLAIERNIAALKADLEAAIPEEVKEQVPAEDDAPAEELPADEASNKDAPVVEEPAAENAPAAEEPEIETEPAAEEPAAEEPAKEEIPAEEEDEVVEALNESVELTEADAMPSEGEIKNLLDSNEYDKPISDAEVEKYLEEDSGIKEDVEQEFDFDEISDEELNSNISDFLNEVYSNVESFTATACDLNESKLIIEGDIKFKSGKTKATKFEFTKCNDKFIGINEDFSVDSNFVINYAIANKSMIVESLDYKLDINNTTIRGCTKK